jgi:hypothetical protein
VKELFGAKVKKEPEIERDLKKLVFKLVNDIKDKNNIANLD